MSISKTEISKLKKAVKEYIGTHKFIFSQFQTMPTLSANDHDKFLSNLPNTTDEERDYFIDEFIKKPFSLAEIDEMRGKNKIRSFLANSPEGLKLRKKDLVESPNYIMFGIEKIPVGKDGKIIENLNNYEKETKENQRSN